MRRRTVVVLLLIVGTGAIAFFVSFGRPNNKPSTEKERIVHAESRRIGAVVNATGTVRLRVGSEVRVGSQLSGIVKKLNVTVGSHVQAGQVIAEIDDRTIQARLADANAQAELDGTALERARVEYERAERLAGQGLVPLQQKQDLELALREAKARYAKSL